MTVKAVQTKRATKVAGRGLGLFTRAYNQLRHACSLLEEAVDFHDEEAAEHVDLANDARALLAEHTKAAKRLAEFIPGVK